MTNLRFKSNVKPTNSKAPELWIDVLRIKQDLSPVVFRQLLQSIPTDWSRSIQKLKFSQDRYLSLFGKLLLIQAASRINQESCIQHTRYNQFKRPITSEEFDFNISHSGNYVACALLEKGNIGIDIEWRKPIDLDEFKHIWRPDEWQQIITASDPVWEFYRMWTLKESIVKANGKGLYLPLESIHVHKSHAQIGEEKWFLWEYEGLEDYALAIATDEEKPIIHFSTIDMHLLVHNYLTRFSKLRATRST